MVPAGQGDNFSLARMYIHFQVGGGKSMTINMSTIDFSGTSQEELKLTGMKPGDVRSVVYSGLIDPSFRVIDPSAGGNNPEGRSLLSMQ